MGTRGFIGFVVDDQEKIAYNHNDSYPGGLGVDVLGWVRRVADTELGWEVARDTVRSLRVVDPNSKATPADIEALSEFARPDVATRELSDWYVLLRETQGDPAAMLRAGVIEDASGFPADSLMAEYGYVVDLDAGRFEAYVGFQKEPHSEGRFAGRDVDSYADGLPQYYPVRLVASWPLSQPPTNEEFMTAVDGAEPVS
jgi:hypothetical protein